MKSSTENYKNVETPGDNREQIEVHNVVWGLEDRRGIAWDGGYLNKIIIAKGRLVEHYWRV